MGTLGKAVGASGGYIAGSRPLVDYLVNRARSFIFSTAPAPAAAAAAAAGIRFIQSAAGEARRELLRRRIAEARARLQVADLKLCGPILPVWIGDESKAVAAAAALRSRGVFVPAIRYPTVARGSARLRVTVTASHTSDEVERLGSAFEAVGRNL